MLETVKIVLWVLVLLAICFWLGINLPPLEMP